MDTAQLKKFYAESIAPALKEQFNYSSSMQIPVLKKIVINQGLGDATQDKKIIDVAINEISTIAGQKAVAYQVIKGGKGRHGGLFIQEHRPNRPQQAGQYER